MAHQPVDLRAPVRVDVDTSEQLAAVMRLLQQGDHGILLADLTQQGRPRARWYAGAAGGMFQPIPPDAAEQYGERARAVAHLRGRLDASEPELAIPV